MQAFLSPFVRSMATVAVVFLVVAAAPLWANDEPAASEPSTAVVRVLDDSQLDPRSDGWDSEAVSDSVAETLNELAEQLQKIPVERNFSPYSHSKLGVPSTEGYRDIFHRDRIRVQQMDPASPVTGSTIQAGIESLLQPWSNKRRVEHAKFKVVGVQLEGAQTTTNQLLELSGHGNDGYVELHAQSTARWTWQAAQSQPILQWLRIDSAELVTSRFNKGHLFADMTSTILAAEPAYQSQLLFGIDYWLERLDRMLTDQFGHHGLAVGDANDDGLDDLYVCQPGGLPNLLLLQQLDGSVRRAVPSAADILDLSRSALMVDLDNDADQDLVVATSTHVLILANDGKARFRLAGKNNVRDANSISAIDVDLDGDLDLYVCVYSGDGGDSRGSPTPIPIHDARNGGRNVLLRNDRAEGLTWQFTDATTDLGLDAQNDRWSYAASWEDYDNDGDPDLYVANDFGRNNLYRNDNGNYVEASSQAKLDEAAFGMSVSWTDFDHDGLMDVYVSNMFSGAGNRIAAQRQFQADVSPSVRSQLQYAARGNSLFRNLGDGTFQDVSETANVTFGRWAWGSLFADVNNDGWEDLLVGNGFVTRENSGDL